MAAPGDVQRLPLVLLPALLGDDALWAHQVRYLSDIADIRVADLTAGDTVAGSARAVLAAAPDRFALAGISMGGYVAFEILRRAPERVDRLCLLDTTARPDTPEQRARRLSMIRIAESGGFARIPPMMLPGLIHPDRLSEDAVAGEVGRMADRIGADAFIRQQRAILSRPDSRPDLHRITVPTLVIVGREDGLTPPDRAAEMAEVIPGSSLLIIPDCGHLSPLERPEAVSAAMRDWLS